MCCHYIGDPMIAARAASDSYRNDRHIYIHTLVSDRCMDESKKYYLDVAW